MVRRDVLAPFAPELLAPVRVRDEVANDVLDPKRRRVHERAVARRRIERVQLEQVGSQIAEDGLPHAHRLDREHRIPPDDELVGDDVGVGHPLVDLRVRHALEEL
jgi:hypothetical protein